MRCRYHLIAYEVQFPRHLYKWREIHQDVCEGSFVDWLSKKKELPAVITGDGGRAEAEYVILFVAEISRREFLEYAK